MRFFYLLIFLFLAAQPACFAYNFIEIDLTQSKIVFNGYHFGNYNVNANLFFDLRKENESFILNVEGKNISVSPFGKEDDQYLGRREIQWLEAKFVKKDNVVFVNYLRSPQVLARGKLDFDKKELLFDVNCNWRENSVLLEGDIEGKIKIWGRLDDFLINGSMNIKNGKYQDVTFSELVLHFLGKPPLFNLSDSEILLSDGSIYKIEGVMNLRDLRNIFPKAEFVSKKVKLDGWEILSEDKSNVGFKKNVNESFDILFDTYDRQNEQLESGAEVRYKLKDDQFLRLRMQEDRTIFGFEKRKEF